MAHGAAYRLNDEDRRTLKALQRDFARRYIRACLLGKHTVVGIEQPIHAGKPASTFTRIDREQVKPVKDPP